MVPLEYNQCEPIASIGPGDDGTRLDGESAGPWKGATIWLAQHGLGKNSRGLVSFLESRMEAWKTTRLDYSQGSKNSRELEIDSEGGEEGMPAGVKLRESLRILNGRCPTGGGKVGDEVGLGRSRRTIRHVHI